MRILIRKAGNSFENLRNRISDPVITYNHMEDTANQNKKQMISNHKQSTWAFFVIEEAIIIGLLILCVWMSL